MSDIDDFSDYSLFSYSRAMDQDMTIGQFLEPLGSPNFDLESHWFISSSAESESVPTTSGSSLAALNNDSEPFLSWLVEPEHQSLTPLQSLDCQATLWVNLNALTGSSDLPMASEAILKDSDVDSEQVASAQLLRPRKQRSSSRSIITAKSKKRRTARNEPEANSTQHASSSRRSAPSDSSPSDTSPPSLAIIDEHENLNISYTTYIINDKLRRYSCNLCLKDRDVHICTRLGDIKRHLMSERHQRKSFSCPLCSKLYTRPDAVIRHLNLNVCIP